VQQVTTLRSAIIGGASRGWNQAPQKFGHMPAFVAAFLCIFTLAMYNVKTRERFLSDKGKRMRKGREDNTWFPKFLFPTAPPIFTITRR